MEDELASLLGRLGIAAGLGLLVGLQRERAESPIAGLRTFAVTAVLGGFCALLALTFGGWVLAAGVVAVGAFVVMGNLIKLRAGIQDPGLTTEVAILLTFVLGAYLMVGRIEVGIVAGGTLAVLLQLKNRTRRLVRWLGDDDVEAVMRFALLTLVILPVLPNQTYGPFDVLNPRQIWLMVVLIVGIGFGGYLLYRAVGTRAGTVLAGILGGLISSTATTVSYARRAASSPGAARISTVVIMLSAAVVFVRVLVEIAVVAPGVLFSAAPPLLAVLGAFTGLSFLAWLRHAGDGDPMPKQENPTRLGPALLFGLLYGAILLASAAGQDRFGAEGLYAIATVSGFAKLDAIVLSTANLTRQGRVSPDTLWRVTLVAVLANLLFKLAICRALGGARLARHVLPWYLAGAGVLGAVLLLWP
ncbi:MAG: MgtC/SapB family protein [bacterium]